MVGKNLSHYHILSELGRGGMGIVFKAQDTKLDRTVAIKVLPSAALASEDDRARFYREAKAAAQLHHPHIASVFEIDEAVPEGANSDDVRPFIAMEFIDGETLDARIKKGPLKLSEAVRVAGEIAEALKAAHAKDIVHRDIKSANVMLDAEGRAKVLDFGLAKTAQSTKLTRMGSTLGTMAYMSPEQARGEEVDFRTDVWALGAVLYEMVSGRLPFPGDYEQAVVYSILNEDPEALTAVRTGVPMSLERITDKCLAKSADRRYQSLSDFIVDLKGVGDEVDRPSQTLSRTGAPVTIPSVAPASGIATTMIERVSKRNSTAGLVGGGLVVGVILALLAVWLLNPFHRSESPTTSPPSVMRLELTLPEELPLAFIGSAPVGVGRTALVLTPDGTILVYAAAYNGTTILVRHDMNDTNFDVLPGTEGAHSPIISPDGQWIAFGAGSEIKKLRLDGGSPVSLASATDVEGIFWSTNGWIYFGDQQGQLIRRVPENGGESVAMPEHSRRYLNGILPDAEHLIVTNQQEGRLQLIRVSDMSATLLPFEGGTTVLTPTGHLIYSFRGRLFGIPFDIGSLSTTQGAVPLIDDLRTEVILMNGQFSAADNGTLVYASGEASDLATLAWLDPGGNETKIDQPSAAYGALAISPSADRIAVVVHSAERQAIQIINLRSGIRTSLTQSGNNWSPVWSPDGSNVVFVSFVGDRRAILSKNPDASGAPDTLLIGEGLDPHAFTPNGDRLIFNDTDEDGSTRIWSVSMEDFDDVQPLTQGGEYHWGPNLSPDGGLMAYTTVTSDRSEILVQPYPPTGERWLVSSGGGEEPIFLSSGTELVYRNGRQWMIVSFTTEPTFRASAPEVYFEGPYINVPGFEYDVSADDQFLLLRPISDAETTNKLNVVVNWFEELKRLAPIE